MQNKPRQRRGRERERDREKRGIREGAVNRIAKQLAAAVVGAAACQAQDTDRGRVWSRCRQVASRAVQAVWLSS